MKSKIYIFALMTILFASFMINTNISFAKKTTTKKVSLAKKAKITLSKTSYTYNGKKKKPGVTVKVNKKKLKKNVNYKITYKNNKVVGKASVIIKAYNKNKKSKIIYTGSKTKKFTIKKAARTIKFKKTSYSATVGDSAFSILATLSKGTSKIQYTSGNTSVLKINKTTGLATIVGAGTAKVTAKVSAGKYYKAASATTLVTINKKPQEIVETEKNIKNFNYNNDKNQATYKDYIASGINVTNLLAYNWSVLSKFKIPGLVSTYEDDIATNMIECENMIPQGSCYVEDYMLVTAYCNGHDTNNDGTVDQKHKSVIYVFDKESGQYLQTLLLDTYSHVGGLTYDTKKKNIWICSPKTDSSNNQLLLITYEKLKNAIAQTKKILQDPNLTESFEIFNQPSTVAYDVNSGYLWVATFDSENDSKMYAYEYVDEKLANVEAVESESRTDLFLGVGIKKYTKTNLNTVLDSPENIDDIYDEYNATMQDNNYQSGSLVAEITNSNDSKGLKLGDLVVEFNGNKINSYTDLDTYIDQLSIKTSSNVSISFIRYEGGQAKLIKNVIALEEGKDYLNKDIKDRVQGLAFTKDGHVIFSRSYCRNTSKAAYVSDLLVYNVGAWTSTKKDWAKWGDDALETVVALPPMVEAIMLNTEKDDDILLDMLFESSAVNYYKGSDGKGESEAPIDSIIQVQMKLNLA